MQARQCVLRGELYFIFHRMDEVRMVESVFVLLFEYGKTASAEAVEMDCSREPFCGGHVGKLVDEKRVNLKV